ncbi:MAG: dienelactone hydrolase family protein [Chthoniobacterales bacterium]
MPFDDVVALNTRLVAETDGYIKSTRELDAHLPQLQNILYSSLPDYAASTEFLRATLRQSIQYPIANALHGNDFSSVQETSIGADELASYSLLVIPALGDASIALVNAVGILIVPKKHDAKMPLIIAAHGRGGMPDHSANGKITLMESNHRDLARGAIERGWAVFEPIYVFYGRGYPENIRDLLTIRAEEAGTSLLAMEFTKTERAIDYLLTRPEFDASRLAMVGMSYGGFNTLYTAALDPRIRVAVVAAYFNDRPDVLDSNEPDGFLDWRFSRSAGALRDPQIAALVCPRPLQIQAGTQDQLFPVEGARKAAPEAREYYRKLGLEDRFDYHEFTGRHDFDGDAAWTFIERGFTER